MPLACWLEHGSRQTGYENFLQCRRSSGLLFQEEVLRIPTACLSHIEIKHPLNRAPFPPCVFKP